MASPDINSWAGLRLSMYAIITMPGNNPVRFDDLVEFTGTWELNNIPSAAITVAVGRKASDGITAATIHSYLDQLRTQLPTKVYLQVTPMGATADITDKWTLAQAPGGMLVFDGYATGTGWSRTPLGAQFTINLQHWLIDLHYASAISGASHPGNPAAFTYGSTFRPNHAKAAGFNAVGWVPMAQATGLGVTRGILENNGLWEGVIQPWMLEVSSQDSIHRSLVRSPGGNARATRALSRMLPAGGAVNTGLDLTNMGTAGGVVARGIATALSFETYRSWMNTTLWGKLVGEFSPSYWLAVAPRIEDAVVIPFAGALSARDNPGYVTIQSNEYGPCELQGQIPQLLRAIAISYPVTSRANAADKTMPNDAGLAAMFPQFPPTEGIIKFKDPPAWLCDLNGVSQFAPYSTGTVSNKPIPGAVGPVVPPPGKPPDADPAATASTYRNLLLEFAHQWYVLEALMARTGELSGKLRFDICPGSQVEIIGAGERFLGKKDQFARNMFGTVSRVSIGINAEAQRAGTSFTLAHLQTNMENIESEVVKPPLYKKSWVAAPLIDGA